LLRQKVQIVLIMEGLGLSGDHHDPFRE